LREAKIYAENGFNGIIIENFGDAPYYSDRVGPEVVATMTLVVNNVIKEVNIPVGIQVMKNDILLAQNL
jgi:predicted TIM-barrel enzyme